MMMSLLLKEIYGDNIILNFELDVIIHDGIAEKENFKWF